MLKKFELADPNSCLNRAKQIIGINIERTLREREKSEVRDAS